MPSRSATARIAASETHPSCCSWTRHRMAMAAEACRPSGYLAICCVAKARFSGVNVKLAGCSSLGASRRTDICSGLSLHAARGFGIQGFEAALPERTCRAEHVIADMGGNLDAIEDRKLGHGLHAIGSGIVDDQLERRLLEDIARDRVLGIVAVLLADDDAVALQQPRAALDGIDLDAFDVELDQIFSV